MADKENQLTPEEKLLKVIQDGGEEDDAAASEVETPTMQPAMTMEPTAADIAAAAAASEAETEAAALEAPVAGQGDEKPAKSPLKLARKEADETAPEPEAEAAPTEEAAEPGVIAAGPLVSKRGGAGVVGIRTVNKCLVAIVLIMIGFAVYEIWASIQTVAPKEPLPDESPDFMWLAVADQAGATPIEEILKAFDEKSIIGPGTAAPVDDEEKKQRQVTTSVEIYVRDNLNLIGRSDDEAIVVDIKEDKMHFLKVGDELTINDQALKVKNIAAESVTLAEGEKEITIE